MSDGSDAAEALAPPSVTAPAGDGSAAAAMSDGSCASSPGFKTLPAPDPCKLFSNAISSLLAMVFLPQKFAFQHRERFHALGRILAQCAVPAHPPDVMLFEQRQAFRADEGPRALRQQHGSARPNRPLVFALVSRQKAAAALLFQAILSALVALPRGLVRELKLEGDY